MAEVKPMKYDLSETNEYEELTENQAFCLQKEFEDDIKKRIFPHIVELYPEINEKRIQWNTFRVRHMIKQVDKRRVYFWIYHGIEMNELKRNCLYSYWILKYGIFYYANEECPDEDLKVEDLPARINELQNRLDICKNRLYNKLENNKTSDITKIKREFFNENIAFLIFIFGVYDYVEAKGGNLDWLTLDNPDIEPIIHSFRFHDLSKEVIMSLGEALVAQCLCNK